MNPESLFFVALWSWMRAHPDCDFDEFDRAIHRIIEGLARSSAFSEEQPS